MSTVPHFHEQADFLRESSGSNIEKTMRKAVRILAQSGIPHYICGGYAVQEHGYPRFTQDVDLIVPDRGLAQEALCMNGFAAGTGPARPSSGSRNPPSPPAPGSVVPASHVDEGPGSVIDPETRVRIDLLPSPERARWPPQDAEGSCRRAPFSGQLVRSGERFDLGPVTLPVPTVVSDEPRVLMLEDLISTKLSAYAGRGIDRAQDYADVVKLIQANALPRQYGVAKEVRALYERIWDELNSRMTE